MGSVLPGSSEPTPYEFAQLQQWCDHARAVSRSASLDRSDEQACMQQVAAICIYVGGQGRFEKVRCIGKGAYGMVFSAVDLERERELVAVKILRPSKRLDRISLERFEEESRILARIEHPNILKLFSRGYIDGLPYLVLELADGQSLATRMREYGERLSVRDSVVLVSRLADALQELHSNAIVHRDVKPSNVLLRMESRGEGSSVEYWPLLSDFGLSKKLHFDPASALTLQGEVLGTLAYMSPEQIRGESLKTQSDLFSLGVILYELVYGLHPFLSISDYQTRTNIVQRAPNKPMQVGVRVSPELDAILMKCLQKDAKHRYQHASELAKDLNSFLRGEAVSVAPPTAWQSLSHLIGAHPVVSTFLGTLLVSMAVTIGLLSREWRVQRGLVTTKQALADDRAEVIQLFLNSMRVTNSSMNDLILAGRRVLPTDLLASLEEQIPLLERSHELAPDDMALQNHLQILLHYASICYHSMCNFPKALEMRQRSYALVERMFDRTGDEKFLMARINGAYWMGMCLQNLRRDDECIDWYRRSIEIAQQLPIDHPSYADAVETSSGVLYQLAFISKKRSLEEGLAVMEEAADSGIMAFENSQRTGALVYAVNSLTHIADWCIRAGRLQEARENRNRVEKLLHHYGASMTSDWHVQECFFKHVLQLTTSYLHSMEYEAVAELAELWDQLLHFYPEDANRGQMQWYCQSRESLEFVSLYFRWIASRGGKDGVVQAQKIDEKMQSAWKACHAQPDTDVELILGGLRENGIETSKLEEMIHLDVQREAESK